MWPPGVTSRASQQREGCIPKVAAKCISDREGREGREGWVPTSEPGSPAASGQKDALSRLGDGSHRQVYAVPGA